MSVRRIALALAITFGVGFGFVLSSCMPPVDGQASDFPPLNVGQRYTFGGPDVGTAGEVLAIGPYPWVEVADGPESIVHINLEQVATIRE